jgi:hypothetical protein
VTSDRTRDASIESLLRQGRRDDGPRTGACLEADTVAAWFDGALSGDELAAAESHAAGCARCQAMLAEMVASEPTVKHRPWWRSLTVRWLAPLAAAATAVTLWVFVAPAGRSPKQTAVSEARSTAAAPAVAPSTAPAPTAERMARPDRQESPEPAKQKAVQSPASAGRRKAGLPHFGGDPVDLLARRREEAQAVQPPAGSAVRPAQAAPPPAASPAPVVPARSQSASAARAALAAPSASTFEIVSPDPAFRWRASRGGLVERSTDGGVTWTVQPTGSTADLTAGSSPSATVVWLAGHGGTVLLSTDGQTWQRRALPEAVDVIGVRAADAKGATVTTADGREFTTNDAGLTWSRTPLQETPAHSF